MKTQLPWLNGGKPFTFETGMFEDDGVIEATVDLTRRLHLDGLALYAFLAAEDRASEPVDEECRKYVQAVLQRSLPSVPPMTNGQVWLTYYKLRGATNLAPVTLSDILTSAVEGSGIASVKEAMAMSNEEKLHRLRERAKTDPITAKFLPRYLEAASRMGVAP